MPYVGRTKAAGLNGIELARSISDTLKKSELLTDPNRECRDPGISQPHCTGLRCGNQTGWIRTTADKALTSSTQSAAAAQMTNVTALETRRVLNFFHR